MPSRHERLFEELGIATDAPALNPFSELGIDPAFAAELLRADVSGKDMELMARNAYRTLSRLYHPDSGAHPDTDRFQRLKEAEKMIVGADRSRMMRWAKTDRAPASSSREAKLRENNKALLERSSEALERTMRLGHHALHYSELTWSQGLLAQRGDMLLLIREDEQNPGISVHRGHTMTHNNPLPSDAEEKARALRPQELDFMGVQRFLQENDSFGLRPGTRIGLYMDEVGRTSILEDDLAFTMDVTAPVAAYREEYDGRKITSKERIEDDLEEWSKTGIPTLHMTKVPTKTTKKPIPVQSTIFPSNRRGFEPWRLPHEVVGHVGDPEFKNRIRKHRQTGAQAIASSARSSGGATYFNINAVPTETLITEDAQYSPLLVTGQDLLLFDTEHRMPALTDVKIMGVIGSHAGSAGEY